MKKLTAIFLAAVMLLALTACSLDPSRLLDNRYKKTDQPVEAEKSDKADKPAAADKSAQVDKSAETEPVINEEPKAAEPVLVSAPLAGNPLDYNITADSVYIQDMYEFMGAAMTVELPDKEDWQNDVVYYPFSGSVANTDDVEEYVNAVCNGSYNLDLKKKYVKEYDDISFYSFAIQYTGTGRVDSTLEDVFSGVACTISLYYILEHGRIEGQLIIPTSMEVVDLGLRRGADKLNLRLGGASVNAGLYLMPDGSFQTDDGRLSVSKGKATILRDGESYVTDAEFDRGKTEDHIWAKNFYRDETIFFSAPASRLMTGDIFTMRDLYYDLNVVFSNADEFSSFRHDIPFLGLGHDGQFITPKATGKNPFEDITVRVMYWEPNSAAVLYIYARLTGKPYEIEALVAPSLARSEGFSGLADERQMTQGQTIELSPDRKFMPNYELFTWEIVEGAGIVEISNTTSSSCTVKALRPGTAVVRVRYNYGIDEPDVLTGIPRSTDHTDTTEYRIYVN